MHVVSWHHAQNTWDSLEGCTRALQVQNKTSFLRKTSLRTQGRPSLIRHTVMFFFSACLWFMGFLSSLCQTAAVRCSYARKRGSDSAQIYIAPWPPVNCLRHTFASLPDAFSAQVGPEFLLCYFDCRWSPMGSLHPLLHWLWL